MISHLLVDKPSVECSFPMVFLHVQSMVICIDRSPKILHCFQCNTQIEIPTRICWIDFDGL